jgi:predicted ArsR family transcriptional regulator
VDDVATISVLHEPLRRRLYDYVAAQDHDVSRSEAAAATGMQRTLVAFHLDKLVDAGLLETTSRREDGRNGPGAGRPAKFYRRVTVEHAASLPPRDYRAVAELLADAVDGARLDNELQAAARRRGLALAAPSPLASRADLLACLTHQGYEPTVEHDSIRLRNCPFHVLAESHPGLVCGMNLALLEGLTDASDAVATIAPRPTGCCVAISIANLD